MKDLFDHKLNQNAQEFLPLADRLRPESFEEFFGQDELVGEGRLLRRAIETDNLPSMIFWGPPGCGKTTLARILAKLTNSFFQEMSAVSAGVKDLKDVVKEADERRKFKSQKTVLFIDEIHRWNKAQQDYLLPYVERGVIILIGATTENPSFEVIAPLLSRSRVYVLAPLNDKSLLSIIRRALIDKERGLGVYRAALTPEAEELLLRGSGGDARIMLNALEIAVKNTVADKKNERLVDKKIIEEALQHKALQYDKKGDEHYNIISAFIKSLRGSDVDAALYWLARMIEAGEDPKFIARRMIILASEDIGNADPRALMVANAVFQAVEKIGWPEAQINLAQGVVYLARAPKSNASYAALLKAKEDVRSTLNLPVPLHLRNAATKLMKELGYGKDYKYTHDDDSHQEFLPEALKGRKYYQENPKSK